MRECSEVAKESGTYDIRVVEALLREGLEALRALSEGGGGGGGVGSGSGSTDDSKALSLSAILPPAGFLGFMDEAATAPAAIVAASTAAVATKAAP